MVVLFYCDSNLVVVREAALLSRYHDGLFQTDAEKMEQLLSQLLGQKPQAI